MKILILSHSSDTGGAERSMIDLFDYWVKHKGVKPHFIVRLPHKKLVPELKKRGWEYTSLRYDNWSTRNPSPRPADRYRATLINTQAVADIEKLITKLKPDVVMTNTLVAPWAALAAHFQRIPHAWFVREYGDIDHQHTFEIGREKTLQDIGTLSSLVVTNSKTLADHVTQVVDKTKVTTLYTPFNLELIEERAKTGISSPFKDPQSLKLVSVGLIAPSKGQDMAAEAVGILTREGHKVELCVIGTADQPQDADPLNKTITKYGIADQVHLIGHNSNPLAILNRADIGVMASQREAFGRVTFEYMATGRAVAGSKSGATPELIDHGKNGFLFEPGSAASLADQLRRYAKDKELIKRHGEEAKRKAARMMKGSHTAAALFDKVTEVAKLTAKDLPTPLNFARRWLDYPGIAAKYIEEAGADGLKRLIYLRLRGKAKDVYVWLNRTTGFELKRRG